MPAPRHRPEESSLPEGEGCRHQYPSGAQRRGQHGLSGVGIRGNPTTSQVWSDSLQKDAHIPGSSPTAHTHHPLALPAGVLSQGSPRHRPAAYSVPRPGRVRPDSASPNFPILFLTRNSEPHLRSPSLSLDGMKHRQTHPRGRQLVRAETVTERKGERDGRDASSAETEGPGEMGREAETRAGVRSGYRAMRRERERRQGSCSRAQLPGLGGPPWGCGLCCYAPRGVS